MCKLYSFSFLSHLLVKLIHIFLKRIYSSCVWSNPETKDGPDTCKCCDPSFYARRLIDENQAALLLLHGLQHKFEIRDETQSGTRVITTSPLLEKHQQQHQEKEIMEGTTTKSGCIRFLCSCLSCLYSP